MSVRQLDTTLRVNTHPPKDTESFAMLMSVESPKSRTTSATRLDKDRPHLSISLDDAITSLQFDEMLLFAGFRLVIAIAIFAFVCILIGSKKPTQQLFDQQRAVTNALAPQTDGHSFQFLDIDNVDSLFDWLTSTLIPSVFPSTQINETLQLDKRRGFLDFSNQILGGLILETTVKGFRRCKSTEAFVNLHAYCVEKEASPSSPVFLDMNMSTTEALTAVTEFKRNDIWSNYHISLFRVTVATYSSEIDTFSVTHLDVNFRDEGRIDPTLSTEAVPDHREQPMTRSVVIIGIGLVYYAIMLLYIEIVKAPSQPHSVLHQGFNRKCEAILWEGVVIIFKFGAIPVFFVLSYRVLTTNIDDELEELAVSYSKSSNESLRALQKVIEALDDAAFWVNLLSVVGAFTILQMGFFAIRQLRFHPRLNVFARTVAASFRQFRDFVVIFIVIFMTFAFAGNSLFGKFVLEFSTASNSVVSCANMLFQTFDYGSIEAFHGSGIFYWTFMVVVNITLLNMMLAIVMRVYETITQDGYDGDVSQRLLTRIRDNYPYRDALESLRFWRSDKRKRCFPSKHDPARSKPSDTDTEAMEYFKKLKFDIRKLTRDNVICEGRIFPPLLLKVLKAKRKYLRRFPNDQLSIVKITATTLTELFPAAKISEEEMDATFTYLRDGFILHEVVSENASNSTLSKGINEAKSDNVDKLSEEIAELNARVAGIESKLDKLLEVMASYRHTSSY